MNNKVDQHLKLNKEDKIILLCARTHTDGKIESEIRSILQQEVNWEYVMDKASEHKLVPLLYFNLNGVCPEKVPPEVLNQLRHLFKLNAYKNLLLSAEMLKVLNILKEHDIDAVTYKGSLLTHLVYGNLAFRQFDDIDIFVFPGDVLKAKKILISEGYRPQFYFNQSLERFYIKSEREFHFVSKNKLNLEIQWNPVALSYSLPKDGKILRDPQDLEEVSFQGFKILNFKPEDLFLIVCLHSAVHFWDHLGRICDISEFIREYKSMDWTKVIHKARKLEIERIISINLFLARDLFGSELPDYFLEKESDEDLKNLVSFVKKNIFGEVDGILNNIKRFTFRYKSRDSRRAGMNDLILVLTAPTREEFKFLELPASLHLFYYLIRPFNLIRKYFVSIF
jgi:hypothetical protein